MDQLAIEAPKAAQLLTLVGLAPIINLVMMLLKRTLAMTEAQIDRFGPLMAVSSGIVLAEIATVVTGGLAQGGVAVFEGALLGLVSGFTAMGIYDTFGGTTYRIGATTAGAVKDLITSVLW